MTTTDPLTDRLQMVSPLARALFHHLAGEAAQRGVRVEYHRQVFYPYDTSERCELLEHGLLRWLDERGLFELADSRDFARIVLVEQEPTPAKHSGKPKLPQGEKPSLNYLMDRWLMTRGLGSTLGNRR